MHCRCSASVGVGRRIQERTWCWSLVVTGEKWDFAEIAARDGAEWNPMAVAGCASLLARSYVLCSRLFCCRVVVGKPDISSVDIVEKRRVRLRRFSQAERSCKALARAEVTLNSDKRRSLLSFRCLWCSHSQQTLFPFFNPPCSFDCATTAMLPNVSHGD
jgi:hypothetical protein